MAASLCRVSVHAGAGSPATVDIALPADLPVGLLTPAIVEEICDASAIATLPWRLSRIGGCALDESMTLTQNDVHDGDLLVLSSVEVWPATRDERCLSDAVAAADVVREPKLVDAAVCLWATGSGAGALAWTGAPAAGSHLTSAAVLATAAAVAMVATARAEPRARRCAALSAIAVVFASVAGFLAVPGGPGAANLLLAAAASAATAIVLWRITGCATTWLAATVTLAGTGATAAAGAVCWPLSVQAAGAVLASVALGLLGVAPRVTIAVAGLTPPIPVGDDDGDGLTAQTRHARATRGHQILAGLVSGCSAAATLAAVLVAVGCLGADASWPGGAALTGALGTVLLLRARTYLRGYCCAALVAGGTASWTATFAQLTTALPGQAYWLSAIAVGAGVAPLAGAQPGPLVRRGADVLECLAIAAVLPLACWVAGLYGIARGWSLP